MNKTVIFTDLDGTLLDEATYSFAAARPALNLIACSGTPLLLCSSKTSSEIEQYRNRLGNTHPFISENGGGIFIPRGHFPFPIEAEESGGYQLIRLGQPYAEIRKAFIRLREESRAKVLGFGDMSPAEVAKLTGLSHDDAVLAMQRDFDEPFVFEGEPDTDFLNAIKAAGLRWTQGRIFHIMGKHDKGRAVDILMSIYRRQYDGVTSIALGDSLNDLAMLAAADRPVLVRHRDGSCDERINLTGLMRTTLPGPAGWNEALLQLTARESLLDIYNAALAAVDPRNAVLKAIRVDGGNLLVGDAAYDLDAYERVIVVGAGKATARMALAIESLLGNRLAAGLIVVKYGHTAALSIIEQAEAAHPVPDENGVVAAHSILNMLHAADEKTLVICLLSGGASALLAAPVEGVTLHDKQDTTRLLLNAGATINELNAVRKHLSAVKGGRLAQAAYPAQMITLILSDVIGDPPDVIASGPTAADGSTFADAWAVIVKYDLQAGLPANVASHLQRGIAGTIPETVKENDPCLTNTLNVIVASLRQALAAAQEQAVQLGFATHILFDGLQGEAREAASLLARSARAELDAMEPGTCHCLLSGGETTVTVRGNGMGGRNQELALAFALEIEGWSGVSLLSAGTDGSDGPNDAAGALVDGGTAAQARSAGIDPRRYLDDNDSYNFFQSYDAATDARSHLKTGPTGTNVMDIQIVLLTKTGQP
jgi:hydroxypyruvate reductase